MFLVISYCKTNKQVEWGGGVIHSKPPTGVGKWGGTVPLASVVYVVKRGHDPPLTIASDRGHSEVVGVLLEAGANINHQDRVT